LKLDGTYTFNAPRELVWSMLQDPDVLARIMPGCEKLERVGDNEFEGMMVIKVGPVQGAFQGNVQLTDLNPPSTYQLIVNGKGPQGIVEGNGQVHLSESENGTLMSYTGQVQVSGRIASVGQRLMLSSAKAITGQSLQNLEKQVQARSQPTPPASPRLSEAVVAQAPVPPPPSAPLPPPSQAEFVAGVMQDVIKDLALAPQQRLLVGLVVGVGVGLLLRSVLNWWTNRLARRVARLVAAQLRDQAE
jgi:hypothetical protein